MLAKTNLSEKAARVAPIVAARVALIVVVSAVFPLTLPAQQPGPDAAGRTVELFRAIRSGEAGELERELANGADPNDTLYGYSALMAATLSGTAQQMKVLIDHGAAVNYLTGAGISALWLAVPDWEKTTLLLDHGADVRHTVEGYGILVKLAIMPGTIRLFHLLIDRGADPKKSARDNTLLYNAAVSGDTAVLSLLMHSGLPVNDTVAIGDYPINAALVFRNFPALKMLVENGADVNVQPHLDSFIGVTPLMFAALNNDRSSVLYLLDHGADPNLISRKGYTALMFLQQSEADDPAITVALLNRGAIASTKASDGTDALYYARKRGNTRSAELLKNAQKQKGSQK